MKDKKKNITGDDQSSYACTNTEKYGDPAQSEQQNNVISDQEAQNVSDGKSRLKGPEAERARNKANE